MFEYNCKVRRVIDGDSIVCDIDLGFSHWIHGEHIRLDGIDTPESRTTDLDEKYFGKLATEFVLEWVEENGPDFRIQTTHKDKYGRYLGKIFGHSGRTINELLVENYLAVEYDGRSKDEIQDLHMANRKKLIDEKYNLDNVVDKIAREWTDESKP